MKRLILIVTLALLTISTQLMAHGLFSGDYKIEDVKEGISKGFENHADAKHCSKFKMSEKEIRNFFSKAKHISAKDKQYKYDWNPCEVTGAVVNGESKAEFVIYGSKVGGIKYTDGTIELLGCKKCGKPFFDF